MSNFTNISDNEFEDFLNKSSNYRELLINLGYGPNSGSMIKIIKDRIIRQNLSTSHFKKVSNPKIGPFNSSEEVLNFINNNYCNFSKLRNYIIKFKLIPYVCSECNLGDYWNNKSLSLHLDHIDGDRLNNHINNLRFLCPNCHSQTSTFGSKNRNYNKKIKTCVVCDSKIHRDNKSGYCKNCYINRECRKIGNPSRL